MRVLRCLTRHRWAESLLGLKLTARAYSSLDGINGHVPVSQESRHAGEYSAVILLAQDKLLTSEYLFPDFQLRYVKGTQLRSDLTTTPSHRVDDDDRYKSFAISISLKFDTGLLWRYAKLSCLV